LGGRAAIFQKLPFDWSKEKSWVFVSLVPTLDRCKLLKGATAL
jgi:hypothetical protein